MRKKLFNWKSAVMSLRDENGTRFAIQIGRPADLSNQGSGIRNTRSD
jgi:hypothetical protein